ncbi:MAG TPA: SHOCT domain-containing protein [Stellaceae bacterium]|nr:SHOCT domain-containing protein [Stellaceae bacterium]
MYQSISARLISFFIVMMEPLQALAQTQLPTAPQPPQWYGPGPWWMWGDGYGWQYWWICPLMMLFMIVVCAAVFFIVRRSWADGPHHWEPPWRGPSHSALQILSERFARGEIQKDEYEEKKATILSGGQR